MGFCVTARLSSVLITRWGAPSLLLAQLRNATKRRETFLLRNLHIHFGKERCRNPLSQMKEVTACSVVYHGAVFLFVNKSHLIGSAQVTFPSVNAFFLLLCCIQNFIELQCKFEGQHKFVKAKIEVSTRRVIVNC